MVKRHDVFTKAKRSEVMSKIRGKGNKDTEVALANLFRANGITGWRRHYPITDRPDFAFPRQKLAVFVDGCFWHDCPKHGVQPKGNRKFWLTKLGTNKVRDSRVKNQLRAKGWSVLRIWEHDLTKSKRASTCTGLQESLPRLEDPMTVRGTNPSCDSRPSE